MKKKLNIKEAFDLAHKNHKTNNFQIAINYYNQILEIEPNHFQSLFLLGALFLQIKKFDLAKPLLEKVIQIDHNNLDANNNLGIVFKELGEFQKAIKFYEKAIEIDSNYIHAQINLGIVFQELRDYQKAISCYEKALEINPNHADTHNNLGATFQIIGEFKKAIECYEKAIDINPNTIDIYENLGNVQKRLGEFDKAIKSYAKIIKNKPNNTEIRNNLSDIFSVVQYSFISETDKPIVKELLLSIFRKNNINHTAICKNAITLLSISEDYNEVQKILNTKSSILENKIIQNLLKEELLLLMLQKSIIADRSLEKILTKARHEILFLLDGTNKDILDNYFDFTVSLAEQCFFNEYIFIQSEKEIDHVNKLKNKIEHNKVINELEIAILSCYIPLSTSKIILNKLLEYKSKNILFNNLITTQVKEPSKEAELRKSIRSFGDISDSVSKKVKDQYEDHPYPRWKYINKNLHYNFLDWLNNEIQPNTIINNGEFDKPNILIAGCGTGNHTSVVERYLNGSILGADLSLTSLAYAKRKTIELGFKNVEFLHADILQLKDLNKKFNIIESVGTLHHMRNPVEGLKVLTDILEPGGFMKLGLYSKIAKHEVVKAKEFIKRKNFKTTIEDMRICRQGIINEKNDLLFKNIISNRDFYSTSGVRDLLFHVKEHCYKILEISEILKNLDLEFFGFILKNPFVKIEYAKLFPEDKKNISLNNWNQYEIKNPDTFSDMYQFWVRKIK